MGNNLRGAVYLAKMEKIRAVLRKLEIKKNQKFFSLLIGRFLDQLDTILARSDCFPQQVSDETSSRNEHTF